MQVDLILENAKVYNIQDRLEIASGQSFQLVVSDFEGPARYFADNDDVLRIRQSGLNGELESKEPGTSTLLIMNSADQIAKKLTISVVDAIIPQATTLGLSADEPVAK